MVGLPVVILIIILVIVILLPALKQARLTTRTVNCLSNLRQVGMTDSIYANGYDDWITPLSVRRTDFPLQGATGNIVEWSEILELLNYLPASRYDIGASAYVPTESPVVCPELAVALSESASDGVMGSHRSTYGHRTRLGNRSGQFIRRSDRELHAASAVPCKVDSARYCYPQQPPLMFFQWDNMRAEWSGGLEDSGGVTIHNGVMNTLFCDGHASAVNDDAMRAWPAQGHADFYFRANWDYVDLTTP